MWWHPTCLVTPNLCGDTQCVWWHPMYLVTPDFCGDTQLVWWHSICVVTPNNCGSSEEHLLHIAVLPPRILWIVARFLENIFPCDTPCIKASFYLSWRSPPDDLKGFQMELLRTHNPWQREIEEIIWYRSCGCKKSFCSQSREILFSISFWTAFFIVWDWSAKCVSGMQTLYILKPTFLL